MITQEADSTSAIRFREMRKADKASWMVMKCFKNKGIAEGRKHTSFWGWCSHVIFTRVKARAGTRTWWTRCIAGKAENLDGRLDTASFRSFMLIHQDSLTRGRLAFAQDAERDSPSSLRLVLHVMTCARWSPAAFEKCLFKRWWKFKALQLR